MSGLVIFLIVLSVGLIAALGWLLWVIRSLMVDAQELPDDELAHQLKRRSLFDFINPFAWWKRNDMVHLFYQRDAKGRFRKVRRH